LAKFGALMRDVRVDRIGRWVDWVSYRFPTRQERLLALQSAFHRYAIPSRQRFTQCDYF